MTPGISTSFDPYEEKIAHLMGIEYVEIWYKDLINKTPIELAVFKDKLDAAHIKVWSIHSPCGPDQELSEIDEDKRFRAVAVQKSLLRLAKFLGASVIVLHPGGLVAPAKRKKYEEKLFLSLFELVEEAEKFQIRYSLENLPPGNLGDHAPSLLRYVETVNSPHLGITFDTGHALLNGDLFQQYELLQEHVIHFHLSDNDGKKDLHLPPRQGIINWDKWFEQPSIKSWNVPMVLECEPTHTPNGYKEMINEVFESVL
ncbi:MAG: sugar phosphate isomerase/epimerase [Bacteroidota bacterium]